jgi:tRNA dimethylallyltransferase
VGKSALGFHLAQRFHGEIVNADSRHVYRGMDIGTAKPSIQEQAAVPCHLFDLLAPDQPFSLATFLSLAREAIAEVHRRGRLLILVGGTGQYVWALLEGWETPHVAPDPELRRRLEEEARRLGPEALHRRLMEVDPQAARRVDPKNPRRLVRALEVAASLGGASPPEHRLSPPPYDPLVLGLAPSSRAQLHQRIDARIDAMLAAGWLEEVRALLDRGYGPELPSFSSMGYRELALHLRGELTLEEAAQRVRAAHRRLVRRQGAWFKPSDPRIRWIVADGAEGQQAEALVGAALRAS